MKSIKDELLLECIEQFKHIEDVFGFDRITTTKYLIAEIEKELGIKDFLGDIEHLKAVEKLKDFAYEVCPLHREDDLEKIVDSL